MQDSVGPDVRLAVGRTMLDLYGCILACDVNYPPMANKNLVTVECRSKVSTAMCSTYNKGMMEDLVGKYYSGVGKFESVDSYVVRSEGFLQIYIKVCIFID